MESRATDFFLTIEDIERHERDLFRLPIVPMPGDYESVVVGLTRKDVSEMKDRFVRTFR